MKEFKVGDTAERTKNASRRKDIFRAMTAAAAIGGGHD